MRLALLLILLSAVPDERAERLFDRMKIQPPEFSNNVERRVFVTLLEKEHWVGAFTEIADRFGRFPENLELTVDFTHTGTETAMTLCKGADRKISFNLKRLVEVQNYLDDIAKKKGEGKQVTFKVPPMKMDRVIYHELTHVLQGPSDAPKWFIEGMAQLVGDDPNALRQFIYDKKKVRALDGEITDNLECYARGHLFWKWLDSRDAATKTYELAFVNRVPWKQALEEATNRSWASLTSDERDWSVRELESLK